MLCFLPLLILFTSCSDSSSSKEPLARGEYITRKSNEFAFIPTPQEFIPKESYPWEKPLVGNHRPITKEFFRCKGTPLNPARPHHNGQETTNLYDCGGSRKHSLPLRNGKEFVYPILLELLNYIQAQTGKRVVVTCGHRCPEHNTYSDPSNSNLHSKHMIGAEVSFYVQGLESSPEKIILLLKQFYQKKYTSTQYTQFERYNKSDTDVSTPPWYNKEIFVKLFKKEEGRNVDNRHPYPYVAIQVRYDEENKHRVLYDWNTAHKNYLRK